MFSFDEMRERLRHHASTRCKVGERTRAAVALLVCDAGPGPELLLIERTEHDQDPWSGHLAFPGGKVEATDRSERHAALRETREEIGLDLAGAEFLGRLDDLRGAHLPVVIACFVFGLRQRPVLDLNRAEVADAFWVPLAALCDPCRHRERRFEFRGEAVNYPAIQVLERGRPYLWGITYRLVAQFLERLGHPVAGAVCHEDRPHGGEG